MAFNIIKCSLGLVVCLDASVFIYKSVTCFSNKYTGHGCMSK